MSKVTLSLPGCWLCTIGGCNICIWYIMIGYMFAKYISVNNKQKIQKTHFEIRHLQNLHFPFLSSAYLHT